MYLTSYLDNGTLSVILTGEIDHHCARAYIDAISSKIEIYSPRECILDFRLVSFMDSSGIAVVINALRYMTKIEGKLSVLGLRNQPMRVFQASGIDRLVEMKEVSCEI